jgi:hypothetical protein
MEKIINSGMFDFISNSKNISQAYERIIGTFLFRILNKVNVINESSFQKIFLNQQ